MLYALVIVFCSQGHCSTHIMRGMSYQECQYEAGRAYDNGAFSAYCRRGF